jgi:hypothetical protein
VSYLFSLKDDECLWSDGDDDTYDELNQTINHELSVSVYQHTHQLLDQSNSSFSGLKPKKDKGPEGKQQHQQQQQLQLLDPDEVHSSSNTTVLPMRRASEVRTQCSDAGHAVLARFDPFVLEPPRDHNLKILW